MTSVAQQDAVAPGPGSRHRERSSQGWFEFPAEVARSENLSRYAAESADMASPFAGDPVYDGLFESLARGLHRQSPKHIILTRERGVGDHAVLMDMARKAWDGEYPFLTNRQFVRIDCGYLPADESRGYLKAILAQVSDHGELVVCLDGLARMLAGGTGLAAGNLDALLAGLSRSACRVVCLMTPREYEERIAGRDVAGEFFTHIDLPEPDTQTSRRLVLHFAHGLEQTYGVTIDDEAIRQAVVLSDSFIPNRRLPAKAVSLLRDVCDDIAFERTRGAPAEATHVDGPAVIEKVAEVSGVPAVTLSGLGDGIDYRAGLRERIVGQEHVIEEVATELGLIRAGLVETGKPASVMLFVGQTGTGKTELAKVIARFYSASKRLKTFTLGNYSESHSVSGVIGVPPGYVGHDQGGRLINELTSDPFGVFLLDEADKAHPDVMQPFLNLFDEGWICDQRGTKANADRAIFILTTNVGQRQIAEMQRRGNTWEEIKAKLLQSLSQIRHTKSNRPVFTPELLARIKRVIVFKPLDEAAMAGITRRLFADMQAAWKDKRQKRLEVSDDLVNWIAAEAHELNSTSQGKEGGRIVRKLIADRVESRIQSCIAGTPDEYQRCSIVRILLEPETEGGAALERAVAVRFAEA